MKANEITVVIPTLNSERHIEECLKALQNQTYKNFTILIVDGYSKDGTVEIAKKYGAEVIYDGGNTRASACNTALKHVNTPYVAFTDDDAIPYSNWLENIIKFFKDFPHATSVGGINYSPPDDSTFAKSVDTLFASPLSGNSRYGKRWSYITYVNHNSGCNVAYKTSSIKSLKFEEDLPTAEDVVFDYKLLKSGGKIFFSPNIVVYHRRRGNLKSFIKQLYRYALGRAMANKRYRELRSIFHILPIGILAFLIILPLFFFISLPFALTLISLYLLFLIAGVSLSTSPHANFKTRFIALLISTPAYISWSIGYIKGWLR